jgi:hypothetical protein
MRVSLVANARDTLNGVGFTKRTEVDVATGGQFSIIDALEAVLEITGPAAVTLATWTAAEFDLSQIQAQIVSKRILSLRMIIDRSFVSRQPKFVEAIHARFGKGSVRSTRTHAKFVVIRNEEWSVVIRTSMNLNFNARLEYLQVTESKELADFWLSVSDSIFEENDEGLENYRRVPEFAGIPSIEPIQRVRMGKAPAMGESPQMGLV